MKKLAAVSLAILMIAFVFLLVLIPQAWVLMLAIGSVYSEFGWLKPYGLNQMVLLTFWIDVLILAFYWPFRSVSKV